MLTRHAPQEPRTNRVDLSMMCLSDAEICPQTYVMVCHDCSDHDMVAMERLLFLFTMIYKLHFIMIVLV